MAFKFIAKNTINNLPTASGVYAFKSRKGFLLYIGKAINIKERVKNHFQQPTFKDEIFIPETEKIGFVATRSEIKALLLEAELIKKCQPKYNTVWRDGKSHLYVFITKEEFPRVFVSHQLQAANHKLLTNVGPFVDGKALKQTLKIMRKVFTFRTCRTLPKKPCLYKELGLCPAPCRNKELKTKNSLKKYNKNIQNLIAVLRGRKTSVMEKLRKEMLACSKKREFEKANKIKNQILSLENVFSHSRVLKGAKFLSKKEIGSSRGLGQLQKVLGLKNKIKRIEGYDISNIQGQEATGSMVVFENGLPNKNEYRKFKIQISGKPNDTAMLQEMIQRRLRHTEWPMPQVMLIDGGKAQLNIAIKTIYRGRTPVNFEIMALAKRHNELYLENRAKPVLLKSLPQETANLILRIRDEAHRFAIAYHKKLRSKHLLS